MPRVIASAIMEISGGLIGAIKEVSSRFRSRRRFEWKVSQSRENEVNSPKRLQVNHSIIILP